MAQAGWIEGVIGLGDAAESGPQGGAGATPAALVPAPQQEAANPQNTANVVANPGALQPGNIRPGPGSAPGAILSSPVGSTSAQVTREPLPPALVRTLYTQSVLS